MRRSSHMLTEDDLNILQQSIDTQQEQENANPSWQEYQCELVTPLYGGGVKAGEVDTQMPIRASEIRGHLRFWWRLLYGTPNDSQGTFKRECDIWGGIGKETIASKVRIKVDDYSLGELESFYDYRKNEQSGMYNSTLKYSGEEGYVLFSAQAEFSKDRRSVTKEPPLLAMSNTTFTLKIGLDKSLETDQITSVNESIRWWVSFGGIGARTRRGLGAIHVTATKPEAINLLPVESTEVIRRGGQFSVKQNCNTQVAQAAWKQAISKLKEFRQGLGVGRNPPSQRPGNRSPAGQSRWPEANSIRNFSKQWLPRHTPTNLELNSFPRAAFGLPVVFHFKDTPNYRDRQNEEYDRNNFDPDDYILEPKTFSKGQDIERMASPLILRPYWNGEAWQPAALLLPGWEGALQQPLKLKDSHYTPNHWPVDDTGRTSAASHLPPMIGNNNEVLANDPLSAFMEFFTR